MKIIFHLIQKITTNEGDISSNSKKIDANKDDISSNSSSISVNKSNIDYNTTEINKLSSFYKLGKIYIDDIVKGSKFVNKNNYYHIFEKEIIYDFIKDSYLEIILNYIKSIKSNIKLHFNRLF